MFVLQVSRSGWSIGFVSESNRIASFERSQRFPSAHDAELHGRRLADVLRLVGFGELSLRVVSLAEAKRAAYGAAVPVAA